MSRGWRSVYTSCWAGNDGTSAYQGYWYLFYYMCTSAQTFHFEKVKLGRGCRKNHLSLIGKHLFQILSTDWGYWERDDNWMGCQS